jgi:hypothetical protein
MRLCAATHEMSLGNLQRVFRFKEQRGFRWPLRLPELLIEQRTKTLGTDYLEGPPTKVETTKLVKKGIKNSAVPPPFPSSYPTRRSPTYKGSRSNRLSGQLQ